MKNWFLHIMLLAGLFGVLTTSCSQEEGLEPQVPTEKIPVSFSIALNNSSARSRADETGKEIWGNNYDGNPDNNYSSEIGNEFENFIDPNLLKAELTLFDLTEENESLLCEVVNITIFETGSDNVYQLVGEVNVNVDITNYTVAKLNVYANFDTNEDGQMLTAFGTNYTGELIGKGRKCIPMWGVKKIENFSLTPGGIKDLGPIYLLRAMSKIEVTWEANSNFAKNGYTINSVGLNKFNTKGNLKPSFSGTEPENTTDYKINAINSLVSPSDASGLLFCQASANSYVIYIPEYENPKLNNDDDDVVIWLDILDKDKNNISSSLNETHGSITMTDIDIVRNHWYKYIIDDVVVDTEVTFELQYQVIDWIEIDNGSLTFGGESGAIHTPKDEEEEEE